MRTFRLATKADVPTIMHLIEQAREIMRSCGNVNQWINGYPSEDTINEDIDNQHCYLCVDDDEIVASFAFIPCPEPTYAKIYEGAWLDDEPYYVVHRLASGTGSHNIFNDVMDYCMSVAGNLRIDTHRDNVIMRHVIEKYGFSYCGIIYLLSGDERLAYQKQGK